MLVPGGGIRIFQMGTRIEQLFDDLQMIASRFVDGRPDRHSECGAAIHAARFEGSLCVDKEPHCFQLSTIRSPIEGIQTRACPSRGIDTLPQQVFCDACAAKKTRARERLSQRVRLVTKASFFVPFDYS